MVKLINNNSEGLIDYFTSMADEFYAKFNRINNLIGDKHWLSIGNYREEILRDFLKQYMPKRFSVGTGFIRCSDGKLSRQIDILIYDSVNYAPLFIDKDFVIITPEAVCAVIEVKSTLDSKELKDALELLDAIKKIGKKRTKKENIFCGIFAYKKEISNKCMMNCYKEFYSSKIDFKRLQRDYDSFRMTFVEVISILREFSLVLGESNYSKELTELNYSKAGWSLPKKTYDKMPSVPTICTKETVNKEKDHSFHYLFTNLLANLYDIGGNLDIQSFIETYNPKYNLIGEPLPLINKTMSVCKKRKGHTP